MLPVGVTISCFSSNFHTLRKLSARMFRSFFCTLAIGAADNVYFVPHIRCWNIHLHLSRFPYQKNLSEYSKRFLPVERTSISCLNGNFKYYHLSYILVLCPLIISSIVSMKKVKEKNPHLEVTPQKLDFYCVTDFDICYAFLCS